MTPTQLKMARHALGLPNDNRRSYRNRYAAGKTSPMNEIWDDLVNRGLAKRLDFSPSFTFFCLTERGARMAIDPTESLCPEDFPNQESR